MRLVLSVYPETCLTCSQGILSYRHVKAGLLEAKSVSMWTWEHMEFSRIFNDSQHPFNKNTRDFRNVMGLLSGKPHTQENTGYSCYANSRAKFPSTILSNGDVHLTCQQSLKIFPMESLKSLRHTQPTLTSKVICTL